MKISKVLCLATIPFLMASCDNSIKPVPTTVTGDLQGCYEIVDKAYTPTDYCKNPEFQVLNIEFKRTDAPLPFESIEDVNATFGIALSDDNATVFKTYGTKEGTEGFNPTQIKSLLETKAGETATLDIVYPKSDKAATFSIATGITFCKFEMKGVMGRNVGLSKFNIEIEKDGTVNGKIRYNPSFPDMDLKGSFDGDNLKLEEYNGGLLCGTFEGTFSRKGKEGTFEGNYTRARDFKNFTFKVTTEK